MLESIITYLNTACFRCAEGYVGERCEYKDLDGSYLRKYLKITLLSTNFRLLFIRYLFCQFLKWFVFITFSLQNPIRQEC